MLTICNCGASVVRLFVLSNLAVPGMMDIGVTVTPSFHEASVLSYVTDVPVMIFPDECPAPLMDRVTFTFVTPDGSVHETLAYFDPHSAVVLTMRGSSPYIPLVLE